MKKNDITNNTEGDRIYIQSINSAENIYQLKDIISSWKWLIPDAWDAVNHKEFSFSEWKYFLKIKKRIKKPTEKESRIYMVISIPENMLNISMVA